jgi:hypothetical protein
MREQTCSKSELIIRVHGIETRLDLRRLYVPGYAAKKRPLVRRLLCTSRSSPADWYVVGAQAVASLLAEPMTCLCAEIPRKNHQRMFIVPIIREYGPPVDCDAESTCLKKSVLLRRTE